MTVAELLWILFDQKTNWVNQKIIELSFFLLFSYNKNFVIYEQIYKAHINLYWSVTNSLYSSFITIISSYIRFPAIVYFSYQTFNKALCHNLNNTDIKKKLKYQLTSKLSHSAFKFWEKLLKNYYPAEGYIFRLLHTDLPLIAALAEDYIRTSLMIRI